MADRKTLSKAAKRRYAAIFIAVIILTGVLRQFLLQKDYEIAPQEYTEHYEVFFRYVYDGDTAVFIDRQGQEFECRFLAVDTPEIGEEGYEQAKDFTRRQLESACRIILEIDPAAEKYDKYERLLAWVWVDGRLLQGLLIQNNLAQIAYVYNDYLYTDYLYRQTKNVTP